MQNLLTKLLHLIGSLIIALTVSTATPTPTPVEVSTPDTIVTATPTPVYNLLDRMHEPSVPELVDEYNQLKGEVASYTPEPAPTVTPIIIYVPVQTYQPTLTPTPMATKTPAPVNVYIGKFSNKLVRDDDFVYTFRPNNPEQLDTISFSLDGKVLKPASSHPNKEWFTWSKDGIKEGIYDVEIKATYQDGSSGKITGTISLPSEDQTNYYGDVTGMEGF